MSTQRRIKKRNQTPIVRLLRMVVFGLIFLMLFSTVSSVLQRKSLAEPWNMSVKVGGFYNEKEDSFDTMFFGSSHMYCSIDPILLEQQSGRKGYILATQEQPLWCTYHYMKEALKTQSPRTIVLEVNMVVQADEYAKEGTNYSAIDPIPFSKNKVEMVWASAPKDERRNYLFSIFKYHGRWEELEIEDYKRKYRQQTDRYRGYVKLPEANELEPVEDVSKVQGVRQPLEKNMEYLKKIYDLAQENAIQLVLLKTPSNPVEADQLVYNAVWQFARERNVPYADYNQGIAWVGGKQQTLDLKQMGLDPTTDYYDQHHLNDSGVRKFTSVFGEFLQKI